MPSFHAFADVTPLVLLLEKTRDLSSSSATTSMQLMPSKLLDQLQASSLRPPSQNWRSFCVVCMASCHSTTSTNYVTKIKSRYDVRTQRNALSTKNGVDVSLLPPRRSSLRKHCQRVNYQAYTWTHAHVAEVQLLSPVGCG